MLGMHRSNTFCLIGLLEHSGVCLGEEKRNTIQQLFRESF